MGTAKYTRVGGYIVSKRNGATITEGDGTEFRLWNPTTKMLDEPFTTFPNAACSVATLVSDDFKKQELYVLFDGSRNGRLIYVYDLLKGSWESLYPGGRISLFRNRISPIRLLLSSSPGYYAQRPFFMLI